MVRDGRLSQHGTVTSCAHPEDLLELSHSYLFTCRACGLSSTFGTVEGRPILGDWDSVHTYRTEHPETRIGANSQECGTCGSEISVITSYTLMVLEPLQTPPLRWESLIGGDFDLPEVRYASAAEAAVGHRALLEAAAGHVLCIASGCRPGRAV